MSAATATPAAADLLGPTALLVVVHDGLDQNRLRNLMARALPTAAVRVQSLPKQDLATELVRLALAQPPTMRLLARELERAARRESGLVRSIPPTELRAHILDLPQLGFRRERARVLWALASHGTSAAADVATELAGAIGRAVKDAQAQLKPESPQQMRQTVLALADEAADAQQRAAGMQQKVARLEEERAHAVAALGVKENHLRAAVEARAELERSLARATARIHELETSVEATQAQLHRELAVDRTRVADQAAVVRLGHLQARLSRVEAERDALLARVAELESAATQRQQQQRALAGALVARESVAQERIRRLRQTLRDLRQQRARPDAPTDETTQELVRDEKVALHVDVANLAAGALRHHRGRVDFTGLLARLADGRRLERAVAYAVEQGDPQKFNAFCAALRSAGYEVRIKKPRVRSDGSMKADWDMGLAMDVVDDTAHVDTVMLCSGDGDFTPLVHLMRRRGKRVEVAAFRLDTHEELRMAAHAFHPLGEETVLR